MHLGPPRPLDSSELGISRTVIPCSLSSLFVTLFLSYAITVPGRTHKVLEPSFHCSRSDTILSLPPHLISVTLSVSNGK